MSGAVEGFFSKETAKVAVTEAALYYTGTKVIHWAGKGLKAYRAYRIAKAARALKSATPIANKVTAEVVKQVVETANEKQIRIAMEEISKWTQVLNDPKSRHSKKSVEQIIDEWKRLAQRYRAP